MVGWFNKFDDDGGFELFILLGDWLADSNWFLNAFHLFFDFWYDTDSRMDVYVSIDVLVISSLNVNSYYKEKMISCRISSALFSVLGIVLRRLNNDSILLLIL